ncbi:protein kinase domain-containing protein, cytoplasmic [Mytilus galloprovincialis]|uniref:Protein kinase domain-containing protein, cytoplasmic n=1 Tax=Mytilus galloprovincialis TaxID=29158 RepID=A0A8B6G9Q5_MYTGA|nr:protein kinase domain-containing protein, cytoplasmic [Mytilus galloprovincialis]
MAKIKLFVFIAAFAQLLICLNIFLGTKQDVANFKGTFKSSSKRYKEFIFETDVETFTQFLLLKNIGKQNMLLKNPYIFNCTNINEVHILKSNVGGGRSKTVDIGMFKGEMVVTKRISDIKPKVISEEYREALFMKEILLRDQLEHPGLIQMLGFCVRYINREGYKDFPLNDIKAVYEYGEEFDIQNVKLTTNERLFHAFDLANLLLYLHKSPLGSLKIGDFKKTHFLLVKNKIKLIDLDYMHNIEKQCQYSQNVTLNACPYKLACTRLNIDELSNTFCDYERGCKIGKCAGYNAKRNIYHIYTTFLKHLLRPELFPVQIQELLSNLMSTLNDNKIEVADLVDILGNIIQPLTIEYKLHSI